MRSYKTDVALGQECSTLAIAEGCAGTKGQPQQLQLG